MYIFWSSIVFLTIWYYGFWVTLQLIALSLVIPLAGRRIVKSGPLIYSTTFGFIAFVQSFIIISTIFHKLTLGYLLSFVMFALIVLWRRGIKVVWADLIYIYKQINNSLCSLDFVIWIPILFSLVLAFLPQSHWDAVHANLYIARWYVNNNNFNPLPEAVTSLFPQNAIAYYSLFLLIGDVKFVSLAFLIPFFSIIGYIRLINSKYQLQPFAKIILTLFLFTPIVIFQASNGYYDNLVLLLAISSLSPLFIFTGKRIHYFASALLLGFAIAAKYFPLIILPILVTNYIMRFKPSYSTLKNVILITAISLSPLLIWSIRSFYYTGSPTFPFFQSIFPTPKLWDPSDVLEGNYMIQTTMSSASWIKGGFITYPFYTYFQTNNFLEVNPGYPSLIYLLVVPIQIYLFIYLIYKIIKHKPITIQDMFYLVSLLIYLGIGIAVRYYRYVWPFQVLLLFSTLILASKVINNKLINRVFLVISLLLIPSVYLSLIGYYRYYPVNHSYLWKPDYYLMNKSVNDPYSYLNNHIRDGDMILDASSKSLLRLHLNASTYTCSWYWTNWKEAIKLPEETVKKFDYIVTDSSNRPISNYCAPMVKIALNSPDYELVFQDGNYAIYTHK
jgi:hypothetical protein